MEHGHPERGRERGFSEFVDLVKSWIPRRSERHESRDFWMPDHICRVCYECDAQFTLFNRKHHCRHCGRVFCAKCTANSVPVSSNDCKRGREDGERIRVCNYCYKQWEQEMAAAAMAAVVAAKGAGDNNQFRCSSPGLSQSPSATSLASTKSSCTVNSSSTIGGGSLLYATRPYQHVSYGSNHSISQPLLTERDSQETQRSMDSVQEVGDPSPDQFGYSLSRSDDEDDDYGGCPSESEGQCFHPSSGYYNHAGFNDIDSDGAVQGNNETREFCIPSDESTGHKTLLNIDSVEAELDNPYDCDASSSIYNMEEADAEPVDFENNGVLWFPPAPENEEDDKDVFIFNEEEDDDATGEFRYLRTSGSFGSGESRSRERTVEEHRKVMKNVLDGHFKALVSQLLQVENLPEGEEGDKDSWLEIVTSLSWEVASLLKPDTSKGGGMDPGGYAKIKCLASGRPSESSVFKGVVCRKNLAHRRMKSRIEKPRLLILGGALEYQRVSNLLSSFDTLLQQEMDHLKMAVAKIGAHHPDVLLVEKTVSRFAQDYLLAKDISLVLNIKRPLLERIARCTGAQIIPSIDHLSSQKIGHCDLFNVQKFVEEHGLPASGGNKPTKNLMFFEGCPKPLGCTVLLRGAERDELKRVKNVVQYAVFAAYHLALETSFLADEGASLPELPLKSPITVALPNKATAIGRSISTVSAFSASNPNAMQSCNRDDMSDHSDISQNLSGFGTSSIMRFVPEPEGFDRKSYLPSPFNCTYPSGNLNGLDSPGIALWMKTREDILKYSREKNNALGLEYSGMCNFLRTSDAYVDSSVPPSHNKTLEAILIGERPDTPKMAYSSDFGNFFQDNINSDNNQEEEQIPLDDFPPSPSDHQSILVSLSTRCVWKGTVCERAHLFRIKYYGSFDKPLGRFLRDHLFDQGYRCRFCEMPSEAHVHCYTHRQGSLTISVKKLPEFLLPGEKDGKIWMWHRCLRCPRRGGIPPETRRVVMSDAAWGLSFGKFLELSFSNHAAASRVASCGHSLHRDCLRFYGFGKMVACFRYASINVHSVYLPPAQLDFSAQSADWIQNEVDEVIEKAKILFTEVLNGINQVSERISAIFPNAQPSKFPGSKLCTVDLRGLWLKEKADFEDSLLKIAENDSKKGQPDIIEINKLHRRLLFHAYLWDRRLIVSAGFENNSNEGLGRIPMNKEKLIIEETVESDSPPKPNSFCTNVDSSLVDGMGDAVLKESLLVASTEGGFLSHSDVNSSNNQKAEVTYNSSYTEGQFHTSCLGTDNKKDPLDSDVLVHRTLSDSEVLLVQNLSETLDAKWTGENGMIHDLSSPDLSAATDDKNVIAEPFDSMAICGKPDLVRSSSVVPSGEGTKRDLSRWVEMPFSNFYHAINKGYASNIPLFHILNEYNPTYIFSFRELNRQGGARVLLPLGVDEIFIPIFDDEPTSIICHALVSPEYHFLMSDERDKIKDGGDSTISLPSYDSGSFNLLPSFDEIPSESFRSIGSGEDSVLSILTSNTLPLDPGTHSKNLHIKVSFSDDGSLGKTKYSVTCYYAKHFQSLRRICCPFELDFIKSISRCKKWGAQGGKSNVFFAKSLDDRFIIKQVTKTELDSFLQFAPRYFKYLSDSIKTRSPTCLAKILGIYQVSSKNLKGGKESKMDVLVMENLLYGRNISRLYDLKGSSRSRYNADSSGNNKVLLDQNLIESMPTSPIFVGNKAKRLLERAVWNDTSFLANIDVMDYSLLVGVDDERYELVLGIIDFMRQYTWDKHLETWVKASGILGGPKNAAPTVISPKQYKKRFRKAMTAYFLMVPDQWSPSSIAPSRSQSDFGEDA